MFSAKIQLIKMIQSKPNDYDLNLQLGMFCVNEKNYSEAKRIFKKLILINKSRYEGYLNLSNIYNISNKINEAEKNCPNRRSWPAWRLFTGPSGSKMRRACIHRYCALNRATC